MWQRLEMGFTRFTMLQEKEEEKDSGRFHENFRSFTFKFTGEKLNFWKFREFEFAHADGESSQTDVKLQIWILHSAHLQLAVSVCTLQLFQFRFHVNYSSNAHSSCMHGSNNEKRRMIIVIRIHAAAPPTAGVFLLRSLNELKFLWLDKKSCSKNNTQLILPIWAC